MNRISVEKAADILLNADIVAIPTETVYGLAGDATSEAAVGKIFSAKGRPADNPIICHIGSVELLEEYAVITDEIRPTLKNLFSFWPGPLTVLLPYRSDKIPDIVTAGSPLAGFRIPAHPVTLDILHLVQKPIAAPSANRSGKQSPVTPEMVEEQFGDTAGIPVIDGGKCNIGIESTVIAIKGENEVEIYRPGGITAAMLKTKGIEVSNYIHDDHDTTERKNHSPGRMKYHYQPDAELVLLAHRSLSWLLKFVRKGTALNYLQFPDNFPHSPNHFNDVHSHTIASWVFPYNIETMAAIDSTEVEVSQMKAFFPGNVYYLSESGDETKIAANLYETLRIAGKTSDIIFVFLPEPADGLFEAVYDRLLRASRFLDVSESSQFLDSESGIRIIRR